LRALSELGSRQDDRHSPPGRKVTIRACAKKFRTLRDIFKLHPLSYTAIMSRTEDAALANFADLKATKKESKRKRRDEDVEDEPKVSKSKKAKRAVDENAAENTSIAEVKKGKKDKKSKKVKEEVEPALEELALPKTVKVEGKKSKKDKKEKKSKNKTYPTPVEEVAAPVSAEQDFIPLGNEPFPDADAAILKKEKKTKKGKKVESAPETNGVAVSSEEIKKNKKSKKEKKDKTLAEEEPAIATNGAVSSSAEERKNLKKDSKSSKLDSITEVNGTEAEEEDAASGKKDRFIVFVGMSFSKSSAVLGY